MPHLDATFQPVYSFAGLDERKQNRAGYNFRHVAFVYQLYIQDLSIVDESGDDRVRRSKLLTKLLADIIGNSLAVYKVWLAQAPSPSRQIIIGNA